MTNKQKLWKKLNSLEAGEKTPENFHPFLRILELSDFAEIRDLIVASLEEAEQEGYTEGYGQFDKND